MAKEINYGYFSDDFIKTVTYTSRQTDLAKQDILAKCHFNCSGDSRHHRANAATYRFEVARLDQQCTKYLAPLSNQWAGQFVGAVSPVAVPKIIHLFVRKVSGAGRWRETVKKEVIGDRYIILATNRSKTRMFIQFDTIPGLSNVMQETEVLIEDRQTGSNKVQTRSEQTNRNQSKLHSVKLRKGVRKP